MLRVVESAKVNSVEPAAGVVTVSGGNAVRVFNVDNSAPSAIDVTISGLTVTGGNGSSGGPSPTSLDGGGISVADENLTLSNVVITGNAALNGNDGGGVAATGAAFLTVRNTTISGNTARSGGGVYFFTNGTLTIQAGGTVNAVGTTMIFTGNSTINMIGNPNLDIVAPSTDPKATVGYLATATFPGTLYYQVPADTAPLTLGGGANATIEGVFYAPTASVTMQGTPGGTLYTDFVVSTLTLAGTPDFNSYAQLPGGASNGLHSVTLVE